MFAPVSGPRRNITTTLVRKARMAWLPDGEKSFEDTFIRFNRMHERDGRDVCCRRTWTTRPPNGEPWRFHRATDKSEVRRQSILCRRSTSVE